MKANILLGVAFAVSTSAQALPQSGPRKAGFPNTAEGLQIFEKAGRQPNATSSVTFDRTFNYAKETWTKETWSWRINITEVAVPDNTNHVGQESANYSQGLHVANIQWQLSWPGADGDTLADYLATTERKVKFSTYISAKPRNITDKYKDEDNGDCAPILGDKCTKSLIDTATSYDSFGFSNLEGCDDTLNLDGGKIHSSIGFELDSNSSEPDLRLNRDETLYFYTSDTYQTGNLSRYEAALQVFVMSFKNNDGTGGLESDKSTVLCRIVEKAAEDENPDNDEPGSDSPDDGESGSDNPDEPGSAAGSWKHPGGIVVGALMINILFTLL